MARPRRHTLAAADVRRVGVRPRDSLKNGALIGLGSGGGMGAAWCIGAIADDSGDIDARVECAEGFTVTCDFPQQIVRIRREKLREGIASGSNLPATTMISLITTRYTN